MGKPEGIVETYMRKRANEMGFLFYKFISPANSGVPDRVVIGNGYAFFVEIKKSPTEEPRKLQRRVINRMIEHGAAVYVIGSKEDAEILLQSYAEKKPQKPKKLAD